MKSSGNMYLTCQEVLKVGSLQACGCSIVPRDIVCISMGLFHCAAEDSLYFSSLFHCTTGDRLYFFRAVPLYCRR